MLYTSEDNISGLRHYHTQARDDTAWLLSRLWQLELADLLHAHFPAAAQSRVARGSLLLIWLTHLLSTNAQRAQLLSEWAGTRLETIRRHTGQYVRPADLEIANLYGLIEILGDDARWEALEAALNQHLLHTLAFVPEQLHLMTLNDDAWTLAEDGTFQARLRRGDRNSHIRAHAIIAVAMPYGMPLLSSTAPSGLPRQEDICFVERAGALLDRPVTFTGEQVLSDTDVRAQIVGSGHAYLYQLPDVTAALRDPAQYEKAAIIDQYEAQCAGNHTGPVSWAERVLAFRSAEEQHAATLNFYERMHSALTEIERLNERRRGKRRLTQVDDLRAVAEEILDTFRLRDLIRLHYEEDVTERVVRHYRGRPTGPRVDRQLRVAASVDDTQVHTLLQQFGWSAYATTLAEPPATIRQLIDQSNNPPVFQRLLGAPLSLVPPTLRQPEYAVGIMRLLMLALRCEGLINLLDARDATPRHEWVSSDIPVV